MTSTLRFGILGAGWPGRQHALGLAHVEGTELRAISELDAARRDAFVAEFSPARAVGRYEDVLADPDIDAVVVSLPNFLHFPATMAALAAGKHVLCEKPPTLTAAEMVQIRAEAARRGLVYAFARQFRFAAEMLGARGLVASGALGRVYFGKGQWLRLRGSPAGIGGWFTDRTRAGGGVMIDLGVHALDAVWFLAGCPRPLSASAHLGRYFGPPGTDVEDSGFAFLRFEGDLSVALELAWAINMSDAGAEAVGWTGLEATNTTLHGTRAALQITPPRLFDVDPRDEKVHRQSPLPALPPDAFTGLPYPTESFARQLTDFCRAVRTGDPPTNNVDQALDLMRMLDAIYRSSAEGREVRIDETPS